MELDFTKRKLIEAVSADQLHSFAKQFLKEASLSGVKDEIGVFQYAKEVLEILGIETKLSFHDSFVSVPVRACLSLQGEVFSCATHSMSISTGEIGLNGNLSYVENLNADVKAAGKIILTEGAVTAKAVKTAERIGAKAIVFIESDFLQEPLLSKGHENFNSDSQKYFSSIPIISITEKQGGLLKNKLASTPQTATVWLMTEVETGWREIPTLTAEIRGQDPDQFVQFSGTINACHENLAASAEDNAIMLEMARVWMTQNTSFHKSLRFVFLSRHYLESWEEQHDDCLLHLHIDARIQRGFELRKGELHSPGWRFSKAGLERNKRHENKTVNVQTNCRKYLACLFEACVSPQTFPLIIIEKEKNKFKEAK